MKNQYLISILVLLFYFQYNFAQKTVVHAVNELETVYLKKQVSSNQLHVVSLKKFEENLILQNSIQFQKAIRAAKKKQQQLFIQTSTSNLVIAEAHYLKLVRKAANRSEDSKTFYILLNQLEPQLEMANEISLRMEKIYRIYRTHSFYGKIEQLPAYL